jgi:hypothetical protein
MLSSPGSFTELERHGGLFVRPPSTCTPCNDEWQNPEVPLEDVVDGGDEEFAGEGDAGEEFVDEGDEGMDSAPEPMDEGEEELEEPEEPEAPEPPQPPPVPG